MMVNSGGMSTIFSQPVRVEKMSLGSLSALLLSRLQLDIRSLFCLFVSLNLEEKHPVDLYHKLDLL